VIEPVVEQVQRHDQRCRRRQMVQPRTALQAAVMQPYQEMMQQQQAQQEAAEAQQSIVPAMEPAAAGTDPATNTAAANGGGADNATVEPPPPAEAPRAGNGSGEKTPAQVLQDLYETRRTMIQQQRQPAPKQ